jgi:glycogen operon protein
VTPYPDRLDSGSPFPLGATHDGLGVNFAIFSANATQIDLCLFDPAGRREIARIELPECTDEVFHGYLPHAQPGLIYGFRAHGRYAPDEGHRFNPNKLLLDPYARDIFGVVRWTDALHGYRVGSRRGDLSFDKRDSASAMPKAVVTHQQFDWSGDTRPNTPWAETVIYEAHVKGLTKLMPDIWQRERGTYAALGHPSTIAHLKRLGVTALELLPVHAFVQDRRLQQAGLTNYWGYNTLGFFAPEARYGTADDLRRAVRRLHAAGIEVILDVVYNHTAEGSELGQTLSFRGLDNASYYRLQADAPRHCVNDTGTGNTLNVAHPRVLQMVADSLRWWAESFHVDGFRFDLGVSLGREGDHGFDPNGGFFDVLRQDPVLRRLKLISEPWDIGPGGYQVGNHPPGFAEWNDKYRDTVRRYWRGDEGMRPALAGRIAGSADLFAHQGRRPWASVNFVTAHDGQTLADFTSYEGKHNEANGEDNQDGSSDNHSNNWGVEGPTDDAGIIEQRARIRRSMLMTLLASLGTPMILGGDEFGRTQQGNNNAYCQDNAISWFDWDQARSPEGASLTEFTARLIALRKRLPQLRSARFLFGKTGDHGDMLDIEWLDERGCHLSPEDWQNPAGKALAVRRPAHGTDGRIEAVSLLLNASPDAIAFHLPAEGFDHLLLADSAEPESAERSIGAELTVQPGAAALILGRARA